MAHFQLNSESDKTPKRKDPRRSLEAPSERPKSGMESIGPKSNEAKVCDAAYGVNAVLLLPFLRDSAGKEFPRAMPKEARAKAVEEESMMRDARKKTVYYATVFEKLSIQTSFVTKSKILLIENLFSKKSKSSYLHWNFPRLSIMKMDLLRTGLPCELILT